MNSELLFLPLLVLFLAGLMAFLSRFAGFSRRFGVPLQGALLALAPLAAFLWLLVHLPELNAGTVYVWQIAWLPAEGAAGLSFPLSLYLDPLSALFGLLITGIGTLVLLYSGYYFRTDPAGVWRFFTYLLFFMSAMLGLVLAGDLITLFIFWEGTSIFSFLLVAYKTDYPSARRGAFKALLLTGGGGIALLAGLLLVAEVAGGSQWQQILAAGPQLRASAWYGLMLGLVALGAFTKSAQFPFHVWLPGAMSAPTPASAYLHSATMVKAGIYLLARLNPALGLTELWFWLLGTVGLLTMVTGAYLGLKQNDLKALLAYSTVSQLGALLLLIGQDTAIAFKALVIGVVAHALYKSALFLLVGIVDLQAGTRDLRRLGGLRRALPLTFLLVVPAALSMAGLPPLFGFLAKETLLATAVHPTLPAAVAWILPAATVFAGSFLLAQSGLLLVDVFLGRRGNQQATATKIQEAPRVMLLAPAIPALLSLAIGLLPEPEGVATFFAAAARTAFGGEVKVSLALWTGLTVPLSLSIVAVSLGLLLFRFRTRVRAQQARLDWSLETGYRGLLAAMDRAAAIATRLQQGRLRFYLLVILSGIPLLLLAFYLAPNASSPELPRAVAPAAGVLGIARLVALIVTVGATLASVLLRRDFAAIVAFGAAGLGVALLMALEPAPDVALVQVIVDVLALVILVLALTRLPRAQRRRASDLTFLQSRAGLVRDGLVALAGGVVMGALTLVALLSRPRSSVVTPFYEENAKPLTGAQDIVGAIIVDFRALDTLLEIAVFGAAGLGVYILLRHTVRRTEQPLLPASTWRWPTHGLGGFQASPFVRALAYLALPLALMLAAVHTIYGHDRPGDGFTAGVLVSLAIAFWYVVFGYEEIRARLFWLRPRLLLSGGLLLALVTGVLAALPDGVFLAPVDWGKNWNLPLPPGFYLSRAFLFEVAIALTVLGSAAYILNVLGHPGREAAPAAEMTPVTEPPSPVPVAGTEIVEEH